MYQPEPFLLAQPLRRRGQEKRRADQGEESQGQGICQSFRMMNSLKSELILTVPTGPEGGQGYWQARPCQPHGQACQQGRQEDQEGQEVDVTTAVPLLLNLDCRCQF